MSDNNNPQPLTHMTDSVTPPTPDHTDHITAAQEQVANIYNATLKAMRNLDDAKSDSNPDAIMRKLVGYVWSRAIDYAQDHVDDELNREVDINVRIEEDCDSSYGLSARITGTVEQSVIPTEVGIEFEIPTIPDARDLDEILKDFKERKLAAETAIHVNLPKENA
jgi:hypothetical protein